jgi:carbamoyl-phosphate synthase large subunit
MKSVGEAMSMGRSFPEALQKALCSMETGLNGLNPPRKYDMETLRQDLTKRSHDRLLVIAEALRMGMKVEEICALSHFDKWFVEQIQLIVDAEEEIKGLKIA